MTGAFPVTISVRVQWGDMDAFGHVNNARYFTWVESARTALFDAVGVDVTGQADVGPILATTACDYLSPVTYPADLIVGARVDRVGRTSLTMSYAVWPDGSPDAPVARASGVIVMVRYRTGETIPIGDDLKTAIDRLGRTP